MARISVRRGVMVGAIALAAAGAWAVSNRESLQTRYAVHRLKSATTEEDRAKWADSLAAQDDGVHELLALSRDGDAPIRAASSTALAKHLESLPPTDSRGGELALALIESFTSGDEAERVALAPLLPALVQRAGAVYGAKCRVAVNEGLKLAPMEARLAAIRAAAYPSVGLRAEVVSHLSAPEAEVRRAAMFAVGPAVDGEAVIGDEELFRWLHDPDADVRTICRSALASRGRSDAEIAFGKRLVSPDANDRLKLLLDLREDDELADAEPWLERLGRDVDPGVRAGAARVMMEINAERKLPAPAWVARLAEADPSPTVRRVARHFRTPPIEPDPALRVVEGP